MAKTRREFSPEFKREERDVERQKHQADREHPQSEDRQDGEEAPEDQEAGDRHANPAEASVEQSIDDPA